jgi:hypothetical protein
MLVLPIFWSNWLSKLSRNERQQDPPHLVFTRPQVKVRTKMEHHFLLIRYLHTDYSKLHLLHVNLDVSTIIVWEVEEWNGIDLSLLHFSAIWLGDDRFLKRQTIALLLHKISHVTQRVCILTKALPLFILLLKIAFVELMVGDLEACTCFTYIGKSKVQSMKTTYHTSWSRLCKCMDSGWWKWETPFYETLSPLFGRLEEMAI